MSTTANSRTELVFLLLAAFATVLSVGLGFTDVISGSLALKGFGASLLVMFLADREMRTCLWNGFKFLQNGDWLPEPYCHRR